MAVLSRLALVAAPLLASIPAAAQQLEVVSQGGRNEVRLVIGAAVHELRSTSLPVLDARLDPVPASPAFGVSWTELGRGGEELTWHAVSVDGTHVTAPRPERYELLLRYASFDPLVGAPAVPPALAAEPAARLFVVQFRTRPIEAYREALSALGAEPRLFLARHAQVVDVAPALLDDVRALPFVRWVGPYQPAYRLERALLLDQTRPGEVPARRVNVLTTERGPGSKDALLSAIDDLGGTVQLVSEETFLVSATLRPDAVRALAHRNDVQWIDLWSPPEDDMDVARAFHGADYVETAGGYTGAGVRVEVMDGGCDTGHPDLQNFAIHGSNGTSSHGTACSGIVAGSGAGNFAARGGVPDAFLSIADYDFLSNRYNHTAELQDPGLVYRAVLQSNSWGNARTTAYTSVSQDMDLILFDHDRISICQSQSNAGNQDSRPQAWAKNIIAVGGIRHFNTATESDDAWSFGASIGPAADGRIKPDLASFYDSILCTDRVGSAGYASGNYYSSFGGTSGATPIVAGHLGLLYEMWADGVFGNPAPGATVFDDRPFNTTAKALLINTATQWTFSGTGHDLTRTHQGWGRPDLARAWDLRTETYVVDETDVLTELASTVHPVTVQAGTPAFKATLVYRDWPGTTASTLHRVNDLDLKVTSPGGTVYWGNNGLLAGMWSTAGGGPNGVDTVENVFVPSPAAGVWQVEVIASELNQDTHVETGALDADYALVVTGMDPASPPMGVTANFSGAPTTGFAPLTVDFTDLSLGGVDTWSWDFGDGGTSTLQHPTHTFTTPGRYTIALTVGGPGGADTETKPDYVLASAPPAAGVSDGSFEIQAAASAPTAPWQIAFGTGHVVHPVGGSTDGAMPTHGAQWCEVTADDTNDALPPSNPGGVTQPPVGGAGVRQSFTYPAGTTVLELDAVFLRNEDPGQASFNDWMSVDVTDGTSTYNLFYRDTFSATSGTSTQYGFPVTPVARVSADLAALFPGSTTATVFTVTALVGNGGDDIQPSKGYVDDFRLTSGAAPPVAEFSGTPLAGTVPLNVGFSDASSGDVTGWSWDFGDGGTSTAQDPSHTYAASGTYTVALTATGPGGADTETKTDYVTVNAAPPVAEFSGSPTSGVAPLSVSFTDLSSGEIGSWSWDFGDGGTSTLASPSHTFASSGSYAVSLTVTGPGGSDTETKNAYIVALEPPPSAEFSGAPTSGVAPLSVSFSDLSAGAVTSWSWDFGDGATASMQNPGHTYAVSGSYTVALTVLGPGGSDTETKTAYVSVGAAPPVADFSGAPTSGTAPLAVSFGDLSSGEVTSWSWDFGDGASATTQNPSHTYTSSGSYTVALTVSGPGGSDTRTRTGYVSVAAAPPVAGFSGSPTTGTAPLAVMFADSSSGEIDSWSWDFGDGGTSSAASPTHVYAASGTYSVALTVSGPGGVDTLTRTDYVTVNAAPPLADFAGAPTSGLAPLAVAFGDLSAGEITSWSWSFGDGGTSTAQSPSHVYALSGSYSVSLTVSGPGGSDTRTRTDYVTVSAAPPVAEFAGTPLMGTSPLSVAFTDLSSGEVTAWSWDFGDGGTSTAPSPSHVYASSGTFAVSLTVTGPGGADTETKPAYVMVDPAPIGTSYCGSVPNSTGVGATILATGSELVAANDVTLTALDLPLGQFGYFLASPVQGFVANPGGSAGNLCLGGGSVLGRFIDLVQNSGATGMFSIPVDVTAVPIAAAPFSVALQPGDTWNFQCWYRDGATSNFTDGVEIGFQ